VIGFLQDMQLSQNSRPRNEEDIKNIETRIEVLNALIDKRDNHTSINLKVETAVEDYKKLIESSRKEYFFNLGTCAMKTKFKVTKTVIRN
jgi:glycerophosphoryl diester phosphodiesterase